MAEAYVWVYGVYDGVDGSVEGFPAVIESQLGSGAACWYGSRAERETGTVTCRLLARFSGERKPLEVVEMVQLGFAPHRGVKVLMGPAQDGVEFERWKAGKEEEIRTLGGSPFGSGLGL
jgi:hypothetical protein